MPKLTYASKVPLGNGSTGDEVRSPADEVCG